MVLDPSEQPNEIEKILTNKGASINYVRRLGGGGGRAKPYSISRGGEGGVGKYHIFFSHKKQCKIARKLSLIE
jgi:hypothetical protein